MDRYDTDYATNNANDLGYIYDRFSILLCTNCSSSMHRFNVTSLKLSALMYLSYFILFVIF